MKILLPVDSSDDHKLISDFVINYKWPDNSSFKFLHVLGAMATEDDYLEAEASSQKMLHRFAARLKRSIPTAHVTCEVSSGDPSLEIISTAGQWMADIIVMGYRVRNDVSGFLAGSVSKCVTNQAPCSVATIRPRQVDPDHVSIYESEEYSGNMQMVAK